VDADLTKSAVRNILQNAIDAVLEGGERRIKVHLTQTVCETEIRVRDYGPGISRKDFPEKSDLSRPFRTTKVLTERSGTGLGLSIAQAAVRAHDGEIRVPDCDVGAEFTIVLKN
jgi:C4-dicarboxylate-specific signal transduction histidine kinase